MTFVGLPIPLSIRQRGPTKKCILPRCRYKSDGRVGENPANNAYIFRSVSLLDIHILHSLLLRLMSFGSCGTRLFISCSSFRITYLNILFSCVLVFRWITLRNELAQSAVYMHISAGPSKRTDWTDVSIRNVKLSYYCRCVRLLITQTRYHKSKSAVRHRHMWSPNRRFQLKHQHCLLIT